MTWITIIIALLLGLLLVTLEIVALPGGVAGVCGGILTAVAIWQTYANYGNVAGTIVLLGSIVVGVVLLVIFMKSKTWRKVSLNEEIDSKTNTIDSKSVQVGNRGITLSRLAPAGNALINGTTVEVHTVSEFVDPDRPIEVIAIEGYKILVKEVAE